MMREASREEFSSSSSREKLREKLREEFHAKKQNPNLNKSLEDLTAEELFREWRSFKITMPIIIIATFILANILGDSINVEIVILLGALCAGLYYLLVGVPLRFEIARRGFKKFLEKEEED